MASGLYDFFEETQAIHVKRRPWMDQCEMILGTAENLDGIIDSCIESGVYGLDLETSGLDNRVFDGRTVDYISGFCMSPDGVRGYYVPVMHDPAKFGKHNVPESVWRPAFERLFASKAVAVFHSGKFDHEFLEFNGGDPLGKWDSPKRWEDTLIGAYLRNTRSRSLRLKDLSEAPPDAEIDTRCGGPGLGWEMIHLHELWGHDKEQKGFDYDFTTLDPSWEPSVWYAASDAICTYRLWGLLKPHTETQHSIYMIEKLCIAATRWMERNRIYVDAEKVIELVALGQQEWHDSIMDLYEAANKILGRDAMPGFYKVLRDKFVPDNHLLLIPEQLTHAKAVSQQRYPDPKGVVKKKGKEWPSIYDVNSAQQLGKMFDEMGIPGLQHTEKTGQVVTRKKVLDAIIERTEGKFPFMGKVKRFREIWKALGSYLYPMLLDCEESDGTMRIQFKGNKVDTGRFSTPAKDEGRADVPGWPKINLQSIPKAGDPNRPACMSRLRECIAARPHHFIVAIDYAGVELRIVTNLSREPKWLAEFFHCASCDRKFDPGDGKSTPLPPPPRCPDCGSDKIGDLHTLTALEIYGSDAVHRDDWKILRGHAKGTNFALCYGGGGMAVTRSTGVNKQEGWRIKHQFDATYSGLKAWWSYEHNFARKHGYVLTGFGRHYPVPDINHADGGFRSKAERNSVNGPVQGTSADITKIAMGLVYKECKKRGWLDLVRMIVTMHDELVFEIHEEVLEEAIAVIVPIMTRNPLILGKKWPIPYTTDVEIGYGWEVPWDLNEMRHGEVAFVGDKKYKIDKQIPAGVLWEDMIPIDGKDPDVIRKHEGIEYKAKDQIPDGMVWDDMPHFPASLAPWFNQVAVDESGGDVPPPPSPSPPPSRETVSRETEAPPEHHREEPPPPSPASPPPASPTVEGGDFIYKLEVPLTISVALKLAEVIRECRHKGTKRLRLLSAQGESLDGWLDVAGHPEVNVSAHEFVIIARSRGL